MIKNSLIHIDIQEINIFSNKLKGGFISDVLQIEIITILGEKMDCVLKMENTNESFLTTMSNQLDLYNREYYFYDVVSKYVPVKFPKPYGLIKDNDFNTIGILMENFIEIMVRLLNGLMYIKNGGLMDKDIVLMDQPLKVLMDLKHGILMGKIILNNPLMNISVSKINHV